MSTRPLAGLRRLALVGAVTAGAVVAPAPATAAVDDLLGRPTVDITVSPGITRTTYPGGKHSWLAVRVVRVDPDAAPLLLRSTVGRAEGTAEPVSVQLARPELVPRPLLGVNGSFFDDELDKEFDLPQGDQTGVSIQAGALLSEASGGGVLLMQAGRPYITTVRTDVALTAGDARTEVHGINRHPGRIPWELPVSDKGDLAVGFQGDTETAPGSQTYTTADEIVLFTPEYGVPTPHPLADSAAPSTSDPGVEAVLDQNGTVRSLREGRGGTTVPPGGKVLQGIGAGAAWLRSNAQEGRTLGLTEKVTDVRFGDEIPLDRSLFAVSGRLIMRQDGKDVYTGSGGDPHARTVVGVDGTGKILLVTVDADDKHPGMDYHQLADLLEALGAVDALNIDGGGSTTLVVGSELVNDPSDGFERPVSDAVFVGQGGYGLPRRTG